jgi:superfamily II DNA or RNA helicase
MNTVKSIKQIPGVKYKAVLSNRIYLKRTPELHDYLLEELTYSLPPKRPGLPREYYCDVTRINDNILTIPIGRQDLIPKFYEIEDKRTLVPTKFPEFKCTLRSTQEEVVQDIEDSCIINANPSWGKTFTGVAIARKLAQKTLVVVHTEHLRKQWIKEIEKTLGIKAGEIGGGKNSTKPIIVVATMQSLRNRMTEVRNMYGTVILDECHHLPASVFKSIIDACKARYKIGLSATLWRKDGKHVMLGDYTGMKVYQPEDENNIKANILVIDSNIEFSSDSKKPWAIRVNELMYNQEYMELVLNLSHAQASRGHKVLTVSDRVEFLETCGDILDRSQVIAGETSREEVDLKNNDIIFGTGKIFSEGVNHPILSSLVMAYPINNPATLKQLIGRIERPYEGKMYPEAIDIMLKGKTARYQASQRLNYYINEGHKLTYI